MDARSWTPRGFARMQSQQSVHKPRMWCGARDSAVLGGVGVGRRDSGVAIPPSWRQKSLANKKGRYIASKRNEATVCALPSIHLPLTREASLVRGEAVDVLLRRLWEWKGSVQREERAPPLRKARGIVRKISLMVGMGSNPSGSRPNFLGATEPHLWQGRQGIVRFWEGGVYVPDGKSRGQGWCYAYNIIDMNNCKKQYSDLSIMSCEYRRLNCNWRRVRKGKRLLCLKCCFLDKCTLLCYYDYINIWSGRKW